MHDDERYAGDRLPGYTDDPNVDEQEQCYGCRAFVVPITDDGERYCPVCGSTDLTGVSVN